MELLYTALGRERISWYEPDSIKWKGSLDKEVLRIERLWWRVRFLGVDDTVRQTYIQRQQIVLLHCVDWIKAIIVEDHECFEIAQFAHNKVEHLLQILFVHFRKDLKMDLLFPITQQTLMIHSFKQGLPALQQRLQQSKLQTELKATIVACFAHFIKVASFTRHTYGQVLMMQDLINWLSEARQLNTLSVFLQLCSLNCNYMGFYRLARKWFDGNSDGTIENVIRFRRLANFFKRIPVRSAYYWKKDRISLALMLAEYLEDKADIAELNSKFQFETAAIEPSGNKANKKLRVLLTIEQLGLVIRILKESNILGSVPTSTIIRFCIDHVLLEGKRQDNIISYEYLKSCINKSRSEVYDLVEQRLNGMLVTLRKFRIALRQRKSKRG